MFGLGLSQSVSVYLFMFGMDLAQSASVYTSIYIVDHKMYRETLDIVYPLNFLKYDGLHSSDLFLVHA